MTTPKKPDQAEWANEFTSPTMEGLLSGVLEDEPRAALALARTKATKELALLESLKWHGVPWRWTMCYSKKGIPNPIMYLISKPESPILAAPIPTSSIESVRLKRLAKTLREPIIRGKVVGGMIWVEWDLVSETQVQELIEFLGSLIADHGDDLT